MVIGSIFVYYFVYPGLRVEIIFKKERAAESGGIDFEMVDIDTSAHWYESISWYLFLAALRGQNIIWILVTSGCLLSRKIWWAVRIGNLCSKLRYFTDQNRPKGGLQENEFWPFSNIEINITNRAEKVGKKWGHLSSFCASFLSYSP